MMLMHSQSLTNSQNQAIPKKQQLYLRGGYYIAVVLGHFSLPKFLIFNPYPPNSPCQLATHLQQASVEKSFNILGAHPILSTLQLVLVMII